MARDLEGQYIPQMGPHRPLMPDRAAEQNTGSVQPNPSAPSQSNRRSATRQSPVMAGMEAAGSITTGKNRRKTDENRSGRKKPFVPLKLLSVSDHQTRIKQISEYLEPLTKPEKSTLLLCWGSEQCAHIIPVFLDNAVEPDTHWSTIRHAWYGERSHWKHWVPWYGVQSVSITEVWPDKPFHYFLTWLNPLLDHDCGPGNTLETEARGPAVVYWLAQTRGCRCRD